MSRKTGGGPQAFHDHYAAELGPRWPELAAACGRPNRHFRLEAGLRRPYYLDPASVYAALQLDVAPGMALLDLCAAPGGKSLVLAQRLFGLAPAACALGDLGVLVEAKAADGGLDPDDGADPDGDGGLAEGAADAEDAPVAPPTADRSDGIGAEGGAADPAAEGGLLVANERSAPRRARLRRVLEECLPAGPRGRVQVYGHDAAAWGQHQQDRYDRILLDIPCSSERHLIQNPAHLADWSPQRTRQLAQQAYTMGLSAGRALKPGGVLLYCTCALSELENDRAVERIVERSRSQAPRYGYRLEPDPAPAAAPAGLTVETGAWGGRIWPDRGGFGPLYFARLRKIAV